MRLKYTYSHMGVQNLQQGVSVLHRGLQQLFNEMDADKITIHCGDHAYIYTRITPLTAEDKLKAIAAVLDQAGYSYNALHNKISEILEKE